MAVRAERAFSDVVLLAQEAKLLPPGADAYLTARALENQDALREAFLVLAQVLVSTMDGGEGAAINFELCQACFLVIVRVLSEAPPWAVDETLALLENIHEVYDVVLTCAETYEWTQPGITGPLRLYMVQALALTCGYDRITGRSLMELVCNDAGAAVSMCTFILRSHDAECSFALQELAARCLVELTTADAIFVADEGTNDQQISKLTALLNKHANNIIQAMIQFDVVDAFGRCICQHQESHAWTDVLVKSFLMLIHNSLLYCSANQKKLRTHIALRSTIIQDIMIPYVENILPALYEAPTVTWDMVEYQNLVATMQTFVVVTFNINFFRGQFLHTDLLLRVMQAPLVLQNPRMLEILVKLHVNVDFAASQHFTFARDMLVNAVLALAPQQRARLARKLSSPSHSLPISKAATKSIEALSVAFDESAAGEPAEPVDAEEPYAGTLWDGLDSALGGLAQQCQELLAQTGHGTATCELTGMLMTDPVKTPDGHFYDRVALEQWVNAYQTDPLSGRPLQMGAVIAAPECQAGALAVQASVMAQQALQPTCAPEPSVTAGLLGDLPSLDKVGVETKKEKPRKIKIRRNLVTDCPDEFKCEIDGKILTHPMRSPSGHVFEKKTLESWVSACGSVCPVSGDILTFDSCVPDKDLQKRIVKWFKETEGL